jgi:prolyl 4-hydroxylase
MQLLFIISFVLARFVCGKVNLASDPAEYGVDCSYPIHYGINKQECPFFWQRYHDMMKKCAAMYSQAECENNERDRMRMNLEQPKGQHNYTEIGFKHMSAPPKAWESIVKWYNDYKDQKKEEKWYRGNTIVNTWDSPSYMVSFENNEFRGGMALKQLIWNEVQAVIEEWVGRKVEPTSLYGIRIYSNNSILSTRK